MCAMSVWRPGWQLETVVWQQLGSVPGAEPPSSLLFQGAARPPAGALPFHPGDRVRRAQQLLLQGQFTCNPLLPPSPAHRGYSSAAPALSSPPPAFPCAPRLGRGSPSSLLPCQLAGEQAEGCCKPSSHEKHLALLQKPRGEGAGCQGSGRRRLACSWAAVPAASRAPFCGTA